MLIATVAKVNCSIKPYNFGLPRICDVLAISTSRLITRATPIPMIAQIKARLAGGGIGAGGGRGRVVGEAGDEGRIDASVVNMPTAHSLWLVGLIALTFQK